MKKYMEFDTLSELLKTDFFQAAVFRYGQKMVKEYLEDEILDDHLEEIVRMEHLDKSWIHGIGEQIRYRFEEQPEFCERLLLILLPKILVGAAQATLDILAHDLREIAENTKSSELIDLLMRIPNLAWPLVENAATSREQRQDIFFSHMKNPGSISFMEHIARPLLEYGDIEPHDYEQAWSNFWENRNTRQILLPSWDSSAEVIQRIWENAACKDLALHVLDKRTEYANKVNREVLEGIYKILSGELVDKHRKLIMFRHCPKWIAAEYYASCKRQGITVLENAMQILSNDDRAQIDRNMAIAEELI